MKMSDLPWSWSLQPNRISASQKNFLRRLQESPRFASDVTELLKELHRDCDQCSGEREEHLNVSVKEDSTGDRSGSSRDCRADRGCLTQIATRPLDLD
jgi:hypothetical protein